MPSSKRRFLPLFLRMQIHRPGVDVMTGLVILLVLIHLLLERAGGPHGVPQYYFDFGLSWDGFSHGKIWQIVSYALLHGDWFHISLNLLMLWLVGGRVIHILGYRKWLQIVVFGVVAGGLLHLLTGMWMTQTGYPESQLVGISGACIALLLTLTTLSPDSKMWPVPISGKYLGLGLIFTELLLWLMQPGLDLPIFTTMGEQLIVWGGAGITGLFQISHACHLGGGLAGWWVARRLLAPTPSLEALKHQRDEREKEVGFEDFG